MHRLLQRNRAGRIVFRNEVVPGDDIVAERDDVTGAGEGGIDARDDGIADPSSGACHNGEALGPAGDVDVIQQNRLPSHRHSPAQRRRAC